MRLRLKKNLRFITITITIINLKKFYFLFFFLFFFLHQYLPRLSVFSIAVPPNAKKPTRTPPTSRPTGRALAPHSGALVSKTPRVAAPLRKIGRLPRYKTRTARPWQKKARRDGHFLPACAGRRGGSSEGERERGRRACGGGAPERKTSSARAGQWERARRSCVLLIAGRRRLRRSGHCTEREDSSGFSCCGTHGGRGPEMGWTRKILKSKLFK